MSSRYDTDGEIVPTLNPNSPSASPKRYYDDEDGPTLKQVMDEACREIDIGAAVLPKPLFSPDVDEEEADQTRYARILQNEFNSIVVEHHLKWSPLCHAQPGPLPHEHPSERLGRYDFYHADRIVDWARARNMKVKGHVLVWHVTTPSFVKDMTPDQVREELKRHIHTTVGHFRGRIHTWDVVNEALAPDGSLAKTVFLEKLGPSYIEDAFRWAHEADPTAVLLYNDNKVEGLGGPNAAKSEAFYQLLANLKKRGVPVHGCGLQAHFTAAGTGRHRPPTPRMIKQQIRRLGQLGLRVNISELDVRVSKLPPNLRQVAQRQIYHNVAAAALTEPAFDGIWLWGFSDRHTWVTHFYYDDEPLIFDEEYGRKESYYGLRSALASLTPGGTVGDGVLLDSDFDEDGNRWGHLWMQPEPETISESGQEGDARPDWEQSNDESSDEEKEPEQFVNEEPPDAADDEGSSDDDDDDDSEPRLKQAGSAHLVV